MTNEYADIRESVRGLQEDVRVLQQDMRDIREELAQMPDKVRGIVKDEQHRWLGGAAGLFVAVAGLFLTATKSPWAVQWLDQHGNWFGPVLAVGAMLVICLLFGRRR